MQIEIVKVSAPKMDGSYAKMDINYIRDGKELGQKLVAINETKEVIQVLQQANPGDVFEIGLKQNGKYWNWISATKKEGGTKASAPSSYKRESTFETPEERAKRQVYIVRQSSISSAISLLGPKAKPESVLELAGEFVDFVFNGPEPKTELSKEDDDIPF